MKYLPLLLFSVLSVSAAQTLVRQELFQGYGTLTSSSTGQFHTVAGNLYQRFGGPYVAPSTNGWSADVHATQVDNYGIINLPASGSGSTVSAGAWVFFKESFTSAAFELPIIWIGPAANRSFRYASISNRITASREFIPGDNVALTNAINPANQWLWLQLSVSNRGGAAYDARFYYKTLGGTLTNWHTMTAVAGYANMAQAGFGSDTQSGSSWNGRIGAASAFTLANLSETAYPSDVVEPSSTVTWFVHTTLGNDTNSGGYATEPWLTAAKVNEESSFAGMFSAPRYASGDTLVLDTTGAPLDLSATNLTLATRGLNVKATNSLYWTNKMDAILTNAHFTATGPPNVYQITTFNNAGFGQSNIVVWEDNKWMNHPTGATWASVSNNVSTNTGSFWTDGTTIYVHPFGDTVPTSDGKSYTRSVARDVTGYGFAINLNAGDMSFRDCYGGKTAMLRATDNTDALAAYVVGTGGSFGGTSVVQHCYGYYGSKHIFGWVASAINSELYTIDCDAEQGVPFASQSPWVSFMSAATDTNNAHFYVNCRTLRGVGMVGSTAGTSDSQSIFLSHNSSSGNQFRLLSFSNCFFPKAAMSLGVAWRGTMDGCTVGELIIAITNTALRSCLFDRRTFVTTFTTAPYLGVTNCVFVPTNRFIGGEWTGSGVRGTVAFENCTFDLSAVPSNDATYRGVLDRLDTTTLVFRNNAFKAGALQHSVFSNFSTNDTISSSNNVFALGTDSIVAFRYTNSATGTSRTFAQWQALGFDANSISTDNIGLRDNYAPFYNSPVIGAGVNVGPSTDFTGNTFAVRNDVGAYEFVAFGTKASGLNFSGGVLK